MARPVKKSFHQSPGALKGDAFLSFHDAAFKKISSRGGAPDPHRAIARLDGGDV